MNTNDCCRILKNILMEAFVVFAIFFAFYLFQDEEVILLWEVEDIGDKLMAFGAIWLIAGFFRLSNGWDCWITSKAVALGVFIMGFGLNTEGIFWAIMVVGGFLMFFAYLINVCTPTAAKIFFLTGLICLCGGYISHDTFQGVSFAKPTEPPEQPERKVDFSTNWTIKMGW